MKSQELRVLNFHGDQIVTFEAAGVRYVAMRRIVENLGMSWSTQRVKLQNQNEKFSCVGIDTTGFDGKTYEMLAMPVEKFPLWLASINPGKVAEAVRPRLERYQAESAIALHDYWTKGVAVRGDADGIVTGLDPAVARVIGGIVKGIVHKEIVTILPEMIRASMAQGLAIRHGKTSGQIWRDHRLPRLKGGSLWLGNRLAEMGAAIEGGGMGELGVTTARLFDPDKAAACMHNGLQKSAQQYVEERKGQGALALRLVMS